MQALIITLMGMGWVFIFLGILVAVLKISGWILGRFSPPEGLPGKPDLVTVKILAVLKSRSLLP